MAEIGRSDFLAAATVLRKNRTVLEGKRKEIDNELSVFKNAEEALVVLGESDRILGEIEAKIADANARLATRNTQVLDAEVASRKVLDGFTAEVAEARKKSNSVIEKLQRQQNAAVLDIQVIEDKVVSARLAADITIAGLNEQISEKETALASLRKTIANLAKL